MQEDLDILKADINAAYRRIPIKPKHQRLCYIAFLHKGEVVIAQHLGLPFGAVSSVHDWDSVGMTLCLFVCAHHYCRSNRRLPVHLSAQLKIPMKRYVDDLFASNRQKSIEVAMNCFARCNTHSLRI